MLLSLKIVGGGELSLGLMWLSTNLSVFSNFIDVGFKIPDTVRDGMVLNLQYPLKFQILSGTEGFKMYGTLKIPGTVRNGRVLNLQ